MAVPIKPNIATKSDYASRPSVPSSQKESASEFNQVVAAIRANYERLILNWATDILVNTTLEVGQYILYTDSSIYKIITSYNVGSPITWDASKAILIAPGQLNIDGGTASSNYNTIPSIDSGNA